MIDPTRSPVWGRAQACLGREGRARPMLDAWASPGLAKRTPRAVGRTAARRARRERPRRAGSCIRAREIGGSIIYGLLDQVEQLVLHLRCEPAEDCVLDAPVLPIQVPAALGQAADRPLDVAEHL